MKLRYYFLLALCFFSSLVMAQPSPILMLSNTSSQLVTALKENRPQLKKNPMLIDRLVRQIILPHVDVVAMSRSVLGREAWANASPDLRQHFIKEFTTLVIRTYSSALSAYNDQEIEFKPIRGNTNGQNRMQVDSMITQHDSPAIPVSYRVVLENQTWKVYDFSVDGVSMVESFRTQFSDDLQGGLKQLIQRLAQHNAGKNHNEGKK